MSTTLGPIVPVLTGNSIVLFATEREAGSLMGAYSFGQNPADFRAGEGPRRRRGGKRMRDTRIAESLGKSKSSAAFR